MPVLELALLRSKSHPNPQTHQDALPPPLEKNIKHALAVLTKSTSTNHPFTLLCESETQLPQVHNAESLGVAQECDMCNLYIFGSWASVAEHEAFLPSEENQALLGLMAGSVDVCWMFHVEGVGATSSEEGGDVDVVTGAKALVDGSAFVALERYVVSKEQRKDFQDNWLGGTDILEKHSGRACVAGWRTGQVYGVAEEAQPTDDEFVVLSGWDSDKSYDGFVAAKAASKDNTLQQLSSTSETRFLRVAVTPH